MRVLRGREPGPEADRAATAELLAEVADADEPAFRVWAPHRQVAFGRRDAREGGFERARETARERGFQPVERSVGGRAVAYTGQTLAFAHARPLTDMRTGLDERYATAIERVVTALRDVGAAVERGEPRDAFCPGNHSVRGVARESPGSAAHATGKVCGIAQRVRQDVALVAGCVLVRDHETIADVLEPVYAELGVRFDSSAVGSVAAAGGSNEPPTVARALEDAFVDGRERRVERLTEPCPADR